MKQETRITIGLCVLGLTTIGACVLVTSCGTFGANPSAPGKVDQLLFTTVTNVVTVTKQVEVPTPVYHTNEVVLYSTNELNQTVTTFSNLVSVVWFTNTVLREVSQTNYTDSVKPAVAQTASGIGTLVNFLFPGSGGLVTNGIIALLGALAYGRSTKQGTNTGAALVQELQTVREFIKALPNGDSYDAVLVNFLQQHQNEEGAATQVLTLLNEQLSNPDAKSAAQGMIDSINALKTITTPIGPVVPEAIKAS